MSTLVAERPATPAEPSRPVASAASVRRIPVWPIGLVLLGIGAALLTTWSVWTGSRSDYYAAIALSMSQNWSNFFFGAMDPAGTVTLDKIPGSYWIPALFVKAFGFSTWAVVLPNALAAVGATLLVAFTAKRLLNPVAGLFAGAVVATTPILVAVARSNQPETFFVLGLAAVAWASAKALTRRSFGWLVVAGLFIALSFQTYMLEAWAVWPALAAAWLCTRQPWLRKLWTGAVAGVVSLAASLWWIALVSLVPADARPYIGSTLGNNPWEMVFGYNGLGRFGDATEDASAYLSFTPRYSGDAGVLRLFNEQLAGQIAWMLPTAALSVVVLWVLRFPRPVTVLLTVWLATFAAMFSAVAGMHQFYTAALAIPMALSIGLAFALARRREKRWPQLAILGAAAATALGIGFSYGGYSVPVSLAQAALAGCAACAIVWEKRMPRAARGWISTLAMVGMLLTPLTWSAVAIANPSAINPVAGGVEDVSTGGRSGTGGDQSAGGSQTRRGSESSRTDRDSTSSNGQSSRGSGQSSRGDGQSSGGRQSGTNDGQGSSSRGRGGTRDSTGSGSGSGRSGTGDGQTGTSRTARGQGTRGTGSDDAALIAYLEENQNGASYLAATFGAQSAAGLIIASDGGSFLPIGGFNSRDAVPTLERFQQLVADGELRYVIVSSSGGSGQNSGTGTSAEIRSWVEDNCTQATDAPTSTLYECTG
ncbi:MAG: glycosyltransferase family 39 protein [Microbacterium sp.]